MALTKSHVTSFICLKEKEMTVEREKFQTPAKSRKG